MNSPPESIDELMARAGALTGKRLGDLAAEFGLAVPDATRRAKGWTGRVAEIALGARSGSRPQPDFPEIGVELKTLPVGRSGRPRESTFICTVTLGAARPARWEESLVWRKLRRVLWVPVEALGELPLAARQIGRPFLWEPDAATEATLRADWEELTELVDTGQLGALDASLGTFLQIRPKAANARALTRAADADGAPAVTLPRGFYLRTALTSRLLAEASGRSLG